MKQFLVEGMSCAACQARVEKAVSKVDGVKSCSVSLLTNSMGVEGTASDSDIIKAVVDAGYGAKVKGADKSEKKSSSYDEALKDTETPKLVKRLISSAFFLIVLMYITMGHNMLNFPLPKFFEHNHIALAITQMLLAIIVMLINQKFFTSGLKSLIHLAPNMDTLVALGSTASFAWSLVVLYQMCGLITNGASNMDLMPLYHNELYFESAAMIPCLITIGKTLEAMSKGRTTDALKSLMKLAPKTARLVVNGVEKIVPIEEVNIGDVFKVIPGENIPVDGVVIDGVTAVNESALTGESIPIDKNVGDKVSAATTNESGVIICKAERVGEDTTLSKIINMVSDAAATKAPIARIADKVSLVFVPSVIGIAFIVTVLWLVIGKESFSFALARGISVLVISCPCALGLATPVAIMVGNGMGAKNGILFKTSESLENLGKMQIIALDKTGTITKGEPKVTDIYKINAKDDKELINVAYALEKNSEHPLAKAIVSYVDGNIGLDQITSFATDFKILPGNGLTAKIDGKVANAGSEKFIKTLVPLDNNVLTKSVAFANEGKTPLFFELDGRLLGIIAVADVVKDDSEKAIKELDNLGVATVMLTGDNITTANAIAKIAGVKNVVAGVMPDGKESVIKKLQQYGKVAMVGDGINDAPALVRADIGIAIGAGTDVAIDSADVVLMNSKLTDVSAAIRLSLATVRNIHQNLFWAFFYNVICIPLAAGLFTYKMNPMVGAAAMSLSSFTVCMNALRLNLFNVHKNTKTNRLPINIDINSNNVGINIVSPKGEGTMKKVVKVEGMMCPHCEGRVKEAFEKNAKVESAVASHEKKTVELSLKEDMTADEAKTIVEDAGYKFIGLE
ncbi:MAG: heavy metal translocating P-type ATPase [Lachnospiraceae bacterium]|nr:heavy metal translocating P-type ATPase [Lachnospiraceae bacterium]